MAQCCGILRCCDVVYFCGWERENTLLIGSFEVGNILKKFVSKDGLFSDTKILFHLCFVATRPIVQHLSLFICEMLWSFVMNRGLSSDGGRCCVVHVETSLWELGVYI